MKFSCRGTWSGAATQARSLQIDFPLSIPDTVKALRDTTTTTDNLTLTELIGLDKNGATALNGLAPTIEANNGTLTITQAKLVITQIQE